MSERVLIIDDHFETLRLTSLVLQRQGYLVDTASSGTAGIEIARENVPNLVLLDIMMPEVDGLEVCRNFRGDNSLRNVPIMMFTARSDESDMEEAFSAGANDYVVKPTRPQELVNRVKSALEKFSDLEMPAGESDDSDGTPPCIGILDATPAEFNTGYLISSNLAVILQEKGHDITMFDMTDSAPPPIGSIVWHSFSPKETSQMEERVKVIRGNNAVLVNLGRASSLPNLPFTTLILTLTPDIASIMDAQGLLKTIGSTTSIHNLMIDFSETPSVTPEMASQFLQHDVKTIIPIDEDIIDRARLQQVPLVETSEGADIKTQLTNFISSHL